MVNIDKCNMAWYLSCYQAYSVSISNSGFIDAIVLSEIATPMTLTKVGVGNKPTTALLTVALTMTYCYAGGTFTDCVWSRVSLAATGQYTSVVQDIAGFTFVRDTMRANTIQGHATVGSLYATRAKDCAWTAPAIIQGAMTFVTCDGITVTDTVFVACVSGTTVTTYGSYVWSLSSNTINCVFSGLSLPVTNCQPYASLMVAATGCANVKLRNIGSRAVPLTLGSANACGLIYSVATNCADFKIQRVYVSNTRTGIMTGDNSSTRVVEENVWGDYADAVDVMAVLNMTRKGMGGAGALTAQTSVYGTHWRDGFTSTTAGRIAVLMNEPTALTSAQVTLENGAAFTSSGGLYMPVIGHKATFEMPSYCLGHTAFTNTALVMAGGTATNYTYGFQIDKNDGGGWSALASGYTATTLGTALAAVTGINAALGFKLRLVATTATTNTTAITSVYVTTVSTTTAQDYQYPLDQVSTTLTSDTSLIGAEIRVYDMDNLPAGSLGSELAGTESLSGAFSFTASASNQVWIQVIQSGYQEYGQAFTVPTASSELGITLSQELNT